MPKLLAIFQVAKLLIINGVVLASWYEDVARIFYIIMKSTGVRVQFYIRN